MEKDIDLSGFTGTTTYYRYMFGCKLTDGTKYLADKAGAFWLLDAIVSYQTEPKVKAMDIQFWTLQRPADDADHSAVLFLTDGRTETRIIQQDIAFTDFPLKEAKIWLQNNILFLPSEC